MSDTTSNPIPSILTRDDGTSIAYHVLEDVRSGKSMPCVVFLGGFMSDMTGSKAIALESFCRTRGQAFLRFDYSGHGQSSGRFRDGTIGSWAEDAIYAIENLTQGPLILVGSSMGGWIMLLTALRLKSRIKALIGIAAAPDFTEDLIARELNDHQRKAIEQDGYVEIPSDYGDEPYVITRALIEDGKQNLLLQSSIPLDIPVRLIQGMKDADVPWQTALRIQENLESDDVEITFVKNGDHRLSEPHDLERLLRTLEALTDGLDEG